MSSPFTLREPVPDDFRFICASWFESFWKGAMQKTGMNFDDYKRGQDALIQSILVDATATILAAESDPDTIIGYSVIHTGTVHYCYVKSVFRRYGAARGLLRGRCSKYSHLTKAGQRVAQSIGLTYDPYTLQEFA